MVNFVLMKRHVDYTNAAPVMKFFDLFGHRVRPADEVDSQGVTDHISLWAAGDKTSKVERPPVRAD